MPEKRGNERRRRWSGADPGGPAGPNAPRFRFNPWLTIPLMLLALLLFNGWLSRATTNQITYSQFVQAVSAGKIPAGTTVTISDSSITGTMLGDGGQRQQFATSLSQNFQADDAFRTFLQEHNVNYRFATPSVFTSLLVNIVPLLLLMLLIYYFLFRRMGAGAGGPLNLGRNRVKIYDRKEMKTSFIDVAGVDEAKEELLEIVDFLKNPKKYQRLGGRIPKGVLLLGPPGCGKTLLARAVAGEANVPFFFMSGSEFVEMFVGLGAQRVRELFQQAKEKAPALVFLDEIDTIGKGRAGVSGAGFGAHDEREQTLNQLLVEMDGFDSSKGVIIMAATNRPDVLDQALVRPGRFDRQVVVDRPDLRGREEILRVHARGVALDSSVELRVIASRTPGFTGADLANVVNEAALLAARREKNAVTVDELEEAIDRASVGLERKSRVMSDRDKERTAVHEMGHALVALFTPDSDPVHRVSIIPRGTAALGLTWFRPLEDRYLTTEPQLKALLSFAIGGRTAEEVYFDGVVSTGAQDDLYKATEVARAMVAELGMSERLGPISLGTDDATAWFPGANGKYSQHTAEMIDEEVRRLLDEAQDHARSILTEKRELLDRLSALLVLTEVIEGEDLKAYIEGAKPIPDASELRGNGQAVTPVPSAIHAATTVPAAPPMPKLR